MWERRGVLVAALQSEREEETRDRAERGSVVSGSDQASVAAKRIPRLDPVRDAEETKRAGLELPAFEGLDRLRERGALVVALGSREERLVGDDREVDGVVIVLGAGERGGIVGEIGFG